MAGAYHGTGESDDGWFVRALGLHLFENSGTADRVIMDQGADHVGSATLAYSDERIYAWLLSRRASDIG